MQIIRYLEQYENNHPPSRDNGISKRPMYYSTTKLTSQLNSARNRKATNSKPTHAIPNKKLYSLPKFPKKDIPSTDQLISTSATFTLSHTKWRAEYIGGGFDFGREGRRKYGEHPRTPIKKTGIRTFPQKYEPSILASRRLDDQHFEKRHFAVMSNRNEYGLN